MLRKTKLVVVLGAMVALGVAGLARADVLGPINFETGYTAGDINNQNGWSKTGGFDAAVANVSGFPAASGYGFGTKALRISDAVTSGSFGDQTFSPSLVDESGETDADSGGASGGTRQSHFEASFQIGTTQTAVQPGLHLNVSPDRGDGARMSYLRFDDLADDRVHVSSTMSQIRARSARSPISTKGPSARSQTARHIPSRSPSTARSGPGNDVVQVFLDGTLVATGGSWEDYYRYDPEQAGNGNKVPTTDDLIFAERGDPDSGNLHKGFLIDNIGLT